MSLEHLPHPDKRANLNQPKESCRPYSGTPKVAHQNLQQLPFAPKHQSFMARLLSLLHLSGLSKPLIVGLVVFLATFCISSAHFAWSLFVPPHMTIHKENTGQANQSLPEASTKQIVVYVSGEVQQAGNYALPENSRIADALQAAGGATQDAALDMLNLAQKLSDADHIHIPKISDSQGEAPAQKTPSENPVITQPPSAKAAGKININTASAEELGQLPGIGPATAQRIVENRTQEGSFKSTKDLMRIPGIGEKKFKKLSDKITV